MGLVVVFITVDSQQTAKKITDTLLTERKAACVNIVPAVESHYWWQGKKESAKELLLIVKTQAELLDELVALVKKYHPYSVPEIVALPIIGGNEAYLKWVVGETH
jgi:periplasmic divalent cation tolerance protein